MPDLEDELIVYLKSKTPITGLVGVDGSARIYLGFPKQSVQLPYIVFQVFDGVSSEHLKGVSGHAENRVQIDCYGATQQASKALAELVRHAPLQGYRGKIGDVFAMGITSTGGYRRGFDSPSQGSSQSRYWHSRDYFISYSERTS